MQTKTDSEHNYATVCHQKYFYSHTKAITTADKHKITTRHNSTQIVLQLHTSRLWLFKLR